MNGVANLMAMEVDSSPPDESLDQMFSDQGGETADFTKVNQSETQVQTYKFYPISDQIVT